MQTKYIAYAHLLKPLSDLADMCARYNALTRPYELKTAAEHARDEEMASELWRTLQPYILLGVIREWEGSGRLHISPRATSDAA